MLSRGPSVSAAAAPSKAESAAPKRSTAASAVPSGGTTKRPRPAAVAEPADDDDSALSRDTLSREEAEAKLDALFGEGVVVALKSSKWKLRLETMDSLLSKVCL